MIRIIVLDDDFIMVLKPRSDLLVQLGHAARSLFNPCLDSLSFWTTQLRRGVSRNSEIRSYYRGILEIHANQGFIGEVLRNTQLVSIHYSHLPCNSCVMVSLV